MTKKALVVDNDFFFVEFMTELLADRGYEVIKAYDGKEGMQALDDHELHFMFVDMVMPKVNGWQLIKYARKKFPNRPFPIIAVSGTIIEQLDELDKIGADYYIAKGPLEKMKTQVNEFMDKMETQPFPGEDDENVFDMGHLYPRRESVELIESLHFQHAIIESVGFGIFVVDRDGRILSTNSRALEILNKSEVDVLNRKIPSLFHTEEKTKLITALKKIAKNPEHGKVVFSLSVNSRQIRLIVTILSLEERKIGWVVALEEMQQWEEQA